IITFSKQLGFVPVAAEFNKTGCRYLLGISPACPVTFRIRFNKKQAPAPRQRTGTRRNSGIHNACEKWGHQQSGELTSREPAGAGRLDLPG
ncbi:hypothetical protein, partial [Mycobacterium sp.]|uniref:hypothetical protein n=1 Tax=Mycobacterium sp. TaxID=1785 RepID=UPI0031D83674